MTRLRELERHRRSLGEIRDILDSMKTLAYMESRKLGRFLRAQSAVVESIGQAAADLLAAWPGILPTAQTVTPAFVLIGTERGFCGDFNRALLRHLESELPAERLRKARLIAVGHKLAAQLGEDPRVVARVDGPSVAEEVPRLLPVIVDQLTALDDSHHPVMVSCVYHEGQDQVSTTQLVPPFRPQGGPAGKFAHPPELNEPPPVILAGLSEHYVFATLHKMLYTSLWAENTRRVAHLEGAVRHLDQQSAAMTRQSHALRQEEIVEEIEVMLLSAADAELGVPPHLSTG